MGRIADRMSALPVGLFETDLAGRLVSADEGFRALALSGGSVPVGSAPWANAHPGDRAAAELSWRRLREAGEPISMTFRVWTAANKMVWLRLDTTCRLRRNGPNRR